MLGSHGIAWDGLGRQRIWPLLLDDLTENFPASSDTYRRRPESPQSNSISQEYSRFVLVDNFVEDFISDRGFGPADRGGAAVDKAGDG